MGFIAVASPGSNLHAAGFGITAQGAAASGKSSAFTAQADDPSALYYNPAGLARTEALRVMVGTSLIIPHTTFRPPVGAIEREHDQAVLVPHVYLVHPIGRRLTAGLGLLTPFGVATDWPEEWAGRFQVTYIAVQATTLNPTLAWRPADWIAVGAGLNVSQVRLTHRRVLNLAALGSEGRVELEGNAIGVGVNAGILLAPSRRWALGVSARSRVRVNIDDGEADFTVPPAVAPAFADGAVHTEVVLPPSIRTGVMVRPRDQWNIEVDAVWTGWSTIDRLRLQFANGLPPDITDLSWHDAMAYSIGTEYRWRRLAARAGYTYDLTPIPDRTVNPLLPDGNRQWFSAGVGLETPRWGLDLAYQLILFHRFKDNAIGARFSSSSPPIDARANGQYRTTAQVIGISANYRF